MFRRSGLFALSCALAASGLAASGLAACGGPLDRKDGAIRIELEDVPLETTSFNASVRAGGRDFATSVPRNSNDVIDVFTAIPIGPASVTVRALAGTVAVASRVNLPIEVLEDQTQTLHLDFAMGPEVEIVSPEPGSRHRLDGGSIPIVVRAVDAALPTDLKIRINDREVPVVENMGRQWSANIDPLVEAPVLPKTISIEIVACAEKSTTACTTHELAVHIDRTLWSTRLPLVTARPSFAPIENGVLAFGDREGSLHLLDASNGTERIAPIALAGPLRRATVIAGDLVIAVDGNGVMHAFAVSTGEAVWARELGDPRPTRPVFDAAYATDRVVIGAGRRLLSIETSGGAIEELSIMSSTIAAAPYIDDRGIIVGDALGLVRTFDINGVLLDEESIGAKVVIQPIRDGLTALVVAERGVVHRLNSASMPIVLSSTPIHDPVRAGASIAIAHGDALTFISGEEATTIAAGGSITFAPIGAPIGRAVLVGINQPPLIKLIDDAGGQRVVSRTEGPPLSGLLLDSSARLLVPANTGALEMFELEEGFFR